MTKRSRTSSMVAELPCEIIHEDILTRLPVKSLLKFRCVCKSWCELFRMPRFVKMYSDQCKNDPKLMLVSDGTKDDDEVMVHSIEYGEKQINVVKIPFLGFQFHIILGSCNGLVLVNNYNLEMGMMYLWNPSTREYKLVPVSPQASTISQQEYIHKLKCELKRNRYGSGDHKTQLEGYVTSSTYGFGYNAIAKDYEIIKISAFCPRKPYYSRYNIYSLRKNSWGSTFQDMSPYVVHKHEMGVLVNDALHWIGIGRNDSRSVIAFDIGDRKFRELPIPPTSEPRFSPYGMASINGCLSIGICYRFGFEFWMMKESWTMLIKFNCPPIRNYSPHSSVLRCLAMYISINNMGFHDVPTDTLEELLCRLGAGNKNAEQLIANSWSATMYTETIVPLQGHDNDNLGQF